jgi:hypothetical protein
LSAPAWGVQHTPIQFLTEMKPLSGACELSQFALRLLYTPANSVPSERSFSTLKTQTVGQKTKDQILNSVMLSSTLKGLNTGSN